MSKKWVLWKIVGVILVVLLGSVGIVSESRSTSETVIPRAWLPVVMNNWCAPAIEFTFVPVCRTYDRLEGKVWCVNPANHNIAVYIFVGFVGGGWWTKPYWSSPLTRINPDGTWTCNIVTGGIDYLATKIAAFLVPEGYSPPLGKGEANLSEELFTHSRASLIVNRDCPLREITFSGKTWRVKESSYTRTGPGPNYFSDNQEDVFVDDQGRLHLKIVQRNGRWYCTEVIASEPMGYGKYIFRLASRVDQLDQNIVLGLFTWDETDPRYYNREIDIEFARWNQPGNQNSQFVVQPYFVGSTMYRFETQLQTDLSTHGFEWQAGRVYFQSLQGLQPFPGPANNEIASWTYSGYYVPPVGNGNARINLWLFNGTPPSNSENAEVIIDSFQYVAQ